MRTKITNDHVGYRLYMVSYGTQSYPVLDTVPLSAIRKICKEMNVGGRYTIKDVRSYENEAGLRETQARVKGKFVNFPIFAVETPIH